MATQDRILNSAWALKKAVEEGTVNQPACPVLKQWPFPVTGGSVNKGSATPPAQPEPDYNCVTDSGSWV